MEGGIACGQQVADGDDAASDESIDAGTVKFLRHVLCVEDDGDHGQAVQVETDLIAETDRAHAHVQRDPEIHEANVDVEAVLRDEEVPHDVDQEGGDRKPQKHIRLAQQEESRQPYDQREDHRVYDVREPPDAL